ncbi:MAG TPA: MFS transporter, partial [Planctomycetota bacterium]|nr:MFS transporter [Planctomycetota bacterium]
MGASCVSAGGIGTECVITGWAGTGCAGARAPRELRGVMWRRMPANDPAPSADEPLPHVVRVLGWVSFFADISSEMAYPLLPLFVVGTLHAPATTLGLIEGLAALLIAVLAFWSGRGSDRTRRRLPAVRWGYGLPVAGKALVALATGWPMVLAGRLVDRVGKGLRGSPRDALIADATPAALRGRAYGFHRAMDTAGACVGGLLSVALLALLASDASTPASVLRLLFGIAAALGLASFALTLLL